jgi:hypothetical protein
MINANQTVNECQKKNSIIAHSIEWLRIEYDLTDPFIDIIGSRPSSTTLTTGRDIDYILTHNVDVKHITTLGMHTPAISDHQGIGIDIDISTFFNGHYSMLERPIPRTLTFNNVKAKTSFIKYVVAETTTHNLWDKAFLVYQAASTTQFSHHHEPIMHSVDAKLTDILLAGAKQCAKRKQNRDDWSPTLCITGRKLVYWKRKYKMARQKLFK